MNETTPDILERIADAFVALDSQWRYTYVNRRASELFGRAPEELIGSHIWTEFPEGKDQPFARAYERALREQVPIQMEEYYAPWDRWFENRIYPCPDGLSIFFTDITERKRAETELRESAERFRRLVETSPETIGIAVEGRLAYINPAGLRLLGAASASELLGREAVGMVHPDDLPRIQERIRRMSRGESVEPDVQRWKRLDGTEVIVEVVSSPTVYQGQPATQTLARDVTERVRAKEQLRRQEAYFRSLTEYSTDLLAVLEANGTIRYQNPSAIRIIGYSAQEMVGTNAFDLVHPEDLPVIRREFQRMLEHPDTTISACFRFRHRDGSWRTLEAEGRNLLHDESVGGLVINSRDVTERVQAQERLRESEERLSLALSSAGQGMWDWTVATGAAHHSPEYARLLGYDSSEFPGEYRSWESRIHPEDREPVLAAVQAHLHGSTPTFGCEYRLRHRDGHWIWVLDRGRVVQRDATGNPLRMLGLITDISASKQTEERLRESEERYRLVLRATNDVIWDYDLVAQRVYWGESLATAFGYDPEVEKPEVGWWEDRVHPEDRERVLAGLDRAIADGSLGWSDEYRFRCKDGHYAIVYDRGLIRRDAAGAPVRMIGSMQDLTRQREAETELRALFSAMRDVIFVMDRDGRYRKIAPSNPSLLYRPSQELIGRTVHEVLPLPQANSFLQSIHASLDGQRTIDIEYSMEIAGREHWFAATISPMTDDTAVWVARDITERRRSEEALRASERRYREIFEQSRDTIYLRRVDGSLIDVNPAAEEVFGASREELLRHNVAEFYADPADHQKLMAELAAHGSVRNYEIRLRRLSGGVFDALVSTTMLRSDDGEVVGFQGTVHDITERKEAERRLLAQEARFRSLIENVHDIVSVLDLDGTVRYISPSVERALGQPVEEFQERSAFDWVHPEDREALATALTPDAGEADVGRTVEFRVRHRNGSWRRLEVVSRNLLHDPAVAGMILTARDVTERREAEEALQRSEAWFRSLTQNALDIITVLDARGRIRYTTPSGARTLGYNPGDMRGAELLALIHPDDQPQVAAALARLASEQTGPVHIVARVRAKDGSWQVHEAIAQSLLHDPAVRGIVVNSHDVTEQRRLEAQLTQAQKMEAVGRLAGGVAHDFNNVLMAITGFAALLEAEIEPDSEAAEYLDEIHKSADRAASLTRQLLAFGRKQALRPKVVNLNSVVEGAGAMLRRLIREDVELVYRLDPRLGQCRVDPHQVEQVLMNLVVNATDALPDGGTVEIATRNRIVTEREHRKTPYLQPGSYAALSVRDTGQGMDPETLARIFEPFFTTKEQGRGTGLGLATVYGIVKQSGGYILVESQPGHGSTFTVLLPRAAAEEEEEAGTRVSAPLRSGSGTVLLAEDEESVRLLARISLEKAGYRVLEARDGEEALRIAQEHPGGIDLLLTDVVMPHLGGYALARRLRERRPSLRVLYMSGYPGNPAREGSQHPDDAEFLPKPITPEALTRRVQEALNAKP